MPELHGAAGDQRPEQKCLHHGRRIGSRARRAVWANDRQRRRRRARRAAPAGLAARPPGRVERRYGSAAAPARSARCSPSNSQATRSVGRGRTGGNYGDAAQRRRVAAPCPAAVACRGQPVPALGRCPAWAAAETASRAFSCRRSLPMPMPVRLVHVQPMRTHTPAQIVSHRHRGLGAKGCTTIIWAAGVMLARFWQAT